MYPGKRRIREGVEEAINGHKNAAQMVIIGVVLKCGGTRKEANQIALNEDAVSLIDKHLTELKRFTYKHLNEKE